MTTTDARKRNTETITHTVHICLEGNADREHVATCPAMHTPPIEPRDQETTVNQPPFDRAELDSQRLRDIRDTLTDIRGVVADSAKMHRYTVDRLDDIHFEARQQTNLLAEIRDAVRPTCEVHVQRDPSLTCGCGRAMPCRHCEPVGLSDPHSTFTEGSVTAPADVDPDEALAKAIRDEWWAAVEDSPERRWRNIARAAREHIEGEGGCTYFDRAQKAEAAMRDEVAEHDKTRAAVLRLTRERDEAVQRAERAEDDFDHATSLRVATANHLGRRVERAERRHEVLRADVEALRTPLDSVSTRARVRGILDRDDERAK